MLITYLETGTLSEFEHLGAGGETVIDSALQLRSTIERKLGKEAADCFAIPKPNADNDRFDWYAPNPGTVRCWDDLSAEQQAGAQKQIRELQGRIRALSQSLSQDEARNSRLLPMFLERVAANLDDAHIFLVGDQLVLSFWGFRQLREAKTKISTAGRVPKRRHGNAKPSPPGPNFPNDGGAWLTGRRIVGIQARWLALTVLVLSVLLLFLFIWRGEQPGPRGVVNGTWRAASASLQDTDTKQPIELAYVLDDGEGEVRVTEQDGSVCRAPVDAVFKQSTLTLTPRTSIVCDNRTPFHRAIVTCRPEASDHAVCDGSFPDGRGFHVDLYKQQ